jgi:hypothetical protein
VACPAAEGTRTDIGRAEAVRWGCSIVQEVENHSSFRPHPLAEEGCHGSKAASVPVRESHSPHGRLEVAVARREEGCPSGMLATADERRSQATYFFGHVEGCEEFVENLTGCVGQRKENQARE